MAALCLCCSQRIVEASLQFHRASGVFEPLQEFTAATPGFHFQTQIVFTNRSDHRHMSHTTGLKQYDMIQCDAVSSDSLTEGHPA